MKKTLLGLATCLAMFSAPAIADADPTIDYNILVDLVNQAANAYEKKLPYEKLLHDVKAQFPNFEDATPTRRERLGEAMDDLIERARKASIGLNDFWRMKAMIIDAKCCTEVRKLWEQAKERGATRRQFEHVKALLEERAEAAKEHPDLREQLQVELDKLMKRYLAGEVIPAVETTYYTDETIRSMLDRALAWLEDMACKRNATREQFEYVRALMKERARNLSEDIEWRHLMDRVDAELERLMQGDVSTIMFQRSDFLKLREMCMQKAREGMTGTPGG